MNSEQIRKEALTNLSRRKITQLPDGTYTYFLPWHWKIWYNIKRWFVS